MLGEYSASFWCLVDLTSFTGVDSLIVFCLILTKFKSSLINDGPIKLRKANLFLLICHPVPEALDSQPWRTVC